jgi:hypothetical protein
MIEIKQTPKRPSAPASCSRQHIRGAGIVMALLGLGGGWWAALGLASLPTSLPWAFLLVAAFAVAFVAASAWVIAGAERLPRIEANLLELWPTIAIIPSSLALGASLFSDALARTQHLALLPIVIMILVGFHFLPLARVLGLQLYQQTGLWLVALALSTWAFVPQTIEAGSTTVALWPLVSGLGGAGILWATAYWSIEHLLPLLRPARA